MSWLRDAVLHADQLEAVLLEEYHLERTQIDGLRSFVSHKGKKSCPETDVSGTFWISTILDIDSRVHVARGRGKNETESSNKTFHMLQQRGHPDAHL